MIEFKICLNSEYLNFSGDSGRMQRSRQLAHRDRGDLPSGIKFKEKRFNLTSDLKLKQSRT